VEQWIAAIRSKETLASANHSLIEIEKWDDAHMQEDKLRNKVKAAKATYEDALRYKFFGF